MLPASRAKGGPRVEFVAGVAAGGEKAARKSLDEARCAGKSQIAPERTAVESSQTRGNADNICYFSESSNVSPRSKIFIDNLLRFVKSARK